MDVINEMQDIGSKQFEPVNDFPKIRDTATFISELVRVCELEVEFTNFDKNLHKISAYETFNLKDADEELILIEYSFPAGSSVLFPWKYQVIMNKNGAPLKVMQAVRYEYLKVIESEAPYLLIVTSTDKGNGGHKLYRMHNDSLENVLEGVKDYFPRTYDAHQDNHINEPNELNLTLSDDNMDGYHDLVFSGRIKTLSETIKVNFIFLFDSLSEHFVEKENYSAKYLYLDKSLNY